MFNAFGPSYDFLSSHLSAWLRAFHAGVPVARGGVFGVEHCRAKIEKCAQDVLTGETRLVFFGHGTDDALLIARGYGKGQHGTSDKYDCLLDCDDFRPGQAISMLAYCCSSAIEMGVRVRALRNSNRFMGFIGKIPFYLETEEGRASFRRAIFPAVSRYGVSGELNEAVLDLLLRGLVTERDRWDSGNLASRVEAAWMSMCLDEQVRLLDRQV